MLKQIALSCLLVFGNVAGITTASFLNYDEYLCGDCCEEEGAYASCEDNERSVTKAREEYVITVSEEVNSLKWEGDCTLLHYTISNNYEVSCLISDFIDLGNIVFDFYYDEEYIVSYALYFAQDKEGTFYSSGRTLDCAKALAGQDLGYVLLASEEEAEEELVEGSKSHRTHGHVYGYFMWTDDDEQVHPLTGAKVKLKVRGSFYSETTYTDDEGYYSFQYSNVWYYGSGMATITLTLENDLIKVKNSSVYAYKYKLQERDVTYEFSKTFSAEEDGDFGAAACLYQGFTCYANAAKEFDYKNNLFKLRISYPSTKVSSVTYMFGEDVVDVPSSVKKDDYPSVYMSWDSLGHEYAHFVNACYGMTALVWGAPHHHLHLDRVQTLIEEYDCSLRKAKRVSERMSFKEAWATVYSLLIQQYLDDEWKNISSVGDSEYRSHSGFYVDYDTYDDVTPESYGDTQELAIGKILYKIASPETDRYDKFSLGFEEFWRISYTYKTKTLSSFIEAMYTEGYSRNYLGLLLSQFNVTPDEIFITNNYLDTCPTLTWSAYKGSNYFNYNYFEMHFLDDDGNELFIKKIKSRGEITCSYTLKEDDWNTILSSCERYFYIYMQVWQTDYRTTGGYYSQTFGFNLPTEYSNEKGV